MENATKEVEVKATSHAISSAMNQLYLKVIVAIMQIQNPKPAFVIATEHDSAEQYQID
jgi:hypothetical protein